MNEDYIYLSPNFVVSASIIMMARHQPENGRTHIWFSGPQGVELQGVDDPNGDVYTKICNKVKPE